MVAPTVHFTPCVEGTFRVSRSQDTVERVKNSHGLTRHAGESYIVLHLSFSENKDLESIFYTTHNPG